MRINDQAEIFRVKAVVMAAFTQNELPGYQFQEQDEANSIIIENNSELRSMLLSFDAESLPSLLSGVLIDLLMSTDRSDVDLVVDVLDVPSSISEKNLAQDKKFLGYVVADALQKNSSELKKAKLQSFEGFSKQQAAAIVDWLLLVRSWPELQGYLDIADEAISYWSGRSS